MLDGAIGTAAALSTATRIPVSGVRRLAKSAKTPAIALAPFVARWGSTERVVISMRGASGEVEVRDEAASSGAGIPESPLGVAEDLRRRGDAPEGLREAEGRLAVVRVEGRHVST